MDRARTQRPVEEPETKAAVENDRDRVPADAERTIEREDARGVPRADHNLDENSGEESPRAHD